MTEQPRTCPSCAAANLPSRELCARCGAGLDDGVLPPHPVRREAPDPPVVRAAPRAHSRWLVPLLAVPVIVLVLVIGLTLAGLGPLAPGPELPPADFDAASYAGEAVVLPLSDIATRTAATDADAEAAVAIADGDPTTAWRSAGAVPAGSDLLETIDLVLDRPSWVDRLELRNGDHLDREAYDGSSPMRQVRLTFDGGVTVLAELLDIGLRAQEVALTEPVLTTVVRIDVLERFAGPNEQLAVSEIDLIGWPASETDGEVASRRAQLDPATGPSAPTGLGSPAGP